MNERVVKLAKPGETLGDSFLDVLAKLLDQATSRPVAAEADGSVKLNDDQTVWFRFELSCVGPLGMATPPVMTGTGTVN